MSREPKTSTTQTEENQAVINAEPTMEQHEISNVEAVEFLAEIQENVGQISELKMEEENLVHEFFSCLLQIIRPFGKTLEVSVDALPENYQREVAKAYLHVTGQLVLVHENGEVDILNLVDKENRGLLVDITGEIMLKLKTVVHHYKSKTEKRVEFLMSITSELQKVAKVFSEE